MGQLPGIFPSNEYVAFRRYAMYFHAQPYDRGAAMVVTAQGAIHLYKLLGRRQAVFFGLVL